MHLLFEIIIAIGGIVGFTVLSVLLGLLLAALIACKASEPDALEAAA